MADSITLKSVQNNGSVTLVANNQTILLQGKAQGPQGIQGVQGDPATNLVTSVAGKQGVVVLDKTDVGLGNADNTNDLNKPISTATQTALDTKASTAALNAHTSNTSNPHSVTKAQVGLGNVDNTSDLNKPISTATKSYVDTADLAHVQATDPHTQYMNSDRGDARYAGQPYSVMAKSQFASLPSSYGILGRIFGNDGYKNDLQVYGLSTQAGTPTPDVPVPIVSTTGNVTIASDNKNLITLDSVNATNNGVTRTFNSDGSITLNGTASATTYFDINNSRKTQIYTGMQLTLSSGINLPTGVKIVLRQSNPNLVYLNVNAGSSSVSGSIGSTASGLAYTFFEVLSGTVLNNVTIRPQLEVGTVATTFEKNINSTQTLPLGTTQLRSLPNGVSDRIYKDGSTWKLEQNVASTVLNGTGTTWTIGTTGATTQRFEAPALTGGAGNDIGALNVSSDKFLTTIVSNSTDTEHLRTSSSANPTLAIVFINQSRLTANTSAAFNTWLAANPTTVIYQLATPITTAITDPTLITALENIRTYQGVTNITASTPVSGSYATQAVNKAQMDTADALKVNKAGDTMTGNLTLPSAIITDQTNGIRTAFNTELLRMSGGTASDGGVIVLGGSTNPALSNRGVLRIGATTQVEWNATRTEFMNRPVRINGVDYLTGTGFPEGVTTAPVGSIYIDKAITNGASSWIKKSGTGNTGWQVLEGDTGWRRITSFLNGWTGVLDVRRVNDVLHYRTAYSGATALVGTAATARVFLAPNTLGAGMFFTGEHRTLNYRTTGAVLGNSYYYHTGWELPAFGTASDTYTFPAGSFFVIDAAWPTTLPGVSA